MAGRTAGAGRKIKIVAKRSLLSFLTLVTIIILSVAVVLIIKADNYRKDALQRVSSWKKQTWVGSESIDLNFRNALLTNDVYYFERPKSSHYFISIAADAFKLALSSRQLGATLSNLCAQVVSSELPQVKMAEQHLRSFVLSNVLDQNRNGCFEILSNRLNFGSITLKQPIRGYRAARSFYFGHTNNLKIHEAALLVAVIGLPTDFNQNSNKINAIKRRQYVLERMVAGGFISRDEERRANAEELLGGSKF